MISEEWQNFDSLIRDLNKAVKQRNLKDVVYILEQIEAFLKRARVFFEYTPRDYRL